MILPSDLYDLVINPTDVPLGLPVVAAVTGFTDAGATVSQVADSLFANYEYAIVAEFNNDELLDYRSRRPVMYFEKDHIVSYEPQMLGIYLMHDEAGNPFLFMHGYEPDFKWEAFVEALEEIFDLLAVSSFTWVHAIGFPVPHTKPVGITVSGNRRDLIDAVSEWKPSVSVPGNVMHLVEYRLGGNGLPMAGFVFLVPHYLAENEYPDAAIAAFQQVSAATGLIFKTDPFRDESARFLRKINDQMAENPELQRMVTTLEQGFQAGAGPMQTSIARPTPKVPSADEIAAELEDYLASKSRNDATDDNGQAEGE